MNSIDEKEMKQASDDLIKRLYYQEDMVKRLYYQNQTMQCSLKNFKIQSDVSEKRLEKIEEFLANNQEQSAEQKFGARAEIKQAFLDCLSTSTGHGLPQLGKADSLFFKIMWVLFISIGLGATIYMIFQTIDDYLQYGVITITKVKRQTEITFPAVTFCSSNNIHEMIIDCKFGIHKHDCHMENITIYDKYGLSKANCIQINHGLERSKLFKAFGEGSEYGYSLVFYNLSSTSFIRYGITDSSVRVSFNDIENHIPPAQISEVSMSLVKEFSLGYPYSQCDQTKHYRQVTCKEDCFKKKMTELCGCIFPQECSMNKSINRKCTEIIKYNKSSISSNCNHICAIECNQVIFGLDKVNSDLEIEDILHEHNEFKKINITQENIEDLVKRITKFYIYFANLEITEITQQPTMTETDLVANIGGLLGLFLGFSLLSSIEAVDLLFRIGFILIQTVRGQPRANTE